MRENVELYGAVLGYSPASMARKVDEVIAFAGLERFRDAKLKSLSSGMMVRLAFSTALRADADILLLDEVMAVGDAQFQRKCIDVFHGLKRQRKTIVLVSHDLASVQRFCEHVVLARQGPAGRWRGEATEVVQTYLAVSPGARASTCRARAAPRAPSTAGATAACASPRSTLDRRATASPSPRCAPWTRLVLRTTVVASAAVEAPVFGLHRSGSAGELVYSINTRLLGHRRPARFAPGEQRAARHPLHAPRSSTAATRVTVAVARRAGRRRVRLGEPRHAPSSWSAAAAATGVADLGAEFAVEARRRGRAARAPRPEGAERDRRRPSCRASPCSSSPGTGWTSSSPASRASSTTTIRTPRSW